MPLWRCPHCATPQPESARCWLCGRSTTTCGACRHFRRGVAGGLGLCGKSHQRLALRGTEVLPCWESLPKADEAVSGGGSGAASPTGRTGAVDPAPHRTFVPVDDLRRAAEGNARPVTATRATATEPPARWSLWGEPDA